MIYGLKKVVGALGPLTFAMLLLVAAACLRASGRRRASAWPAIIAGATAYLGAIAPVGDALLGRLERQYPPLSSNSLPQVAHVVVLGSGYAPHDGIPVTGALDADGLARIVEGIRLVRRIESARLVLSGGAPAGMTPAAIGYAELARQLGVAEPSLVVLDRPLDTAAEAAEISALLDDSPFILVTSAYHMPRAMRLMQAAGARPIPAPTGHRVWQSAPWDWRRLLPTSAGLAKIERALHESLGLAAAAVGLQ